MDLGAYEKTQNASTAAAFRPLKAKGFFDEASTRKFEPGLFSGGQGYMAHIYLIAALVLHIVAMMVTCVAASEHWDMEDPVNSTLSKNDKYQKEEVEMAATAMAVCSVLAVVLTVLWYGFKMRANDNQLVGTICIGLFFATLGANFTVKMWTLFGNHPADRNTKHDTMVSLALYFNLFVCASTIAYPSSGITSKMD